MRALTPGDLIPYAEYEQRREAYRQDIIELKRRRRLALGDKITLVFESRATVQFQIQEMIRVERLFEPQKVQEELEVYNALLPGQGELSATLLIELTEPDSMKQWLDLFQGLDHGEKVAIRAGTELAYGQFEGGRSHETKISAVHFVRFRPTEGMVKTFADPALRVVVTVNHAGYEAEAEAPWALREEWLADLSVER